MGQRLPEFMVPAVVIVLDELPRTVGGKVDRDRLPDPEGHRPDVSVGFEGPRNPTEEAIADVWRQVLRVDRIGIHDDFFDLGGHSLLATLAVARLVKALDRPVDVRTFFAHPTIAEFAAALPASTAGAAPAITRLRRSGDFPLSFAQERMWFLHRLGPTRPTTWRRWHGGWTDRCTGTGSTGRCGSSSTGTSRCGPPSRWSTHSRCSGSPPSAT
ncbi:phosphopantetheine-binding protein [Micromonospora sp. BRA006-A]|nr:phosphopantetheine-binding protein [Micromonospora sp. BRA006-A]